MPLVLVLVPISIVVLPVLLRGESPSESVAEVRGRMPPCSLRNALFGYGELRQRYLLLIDELDQFDVEAQRL
jgi:hypothetical protein